MAPIRPSPRPLAYRTAAQYARHPLGGLAYRLPESHELHRLEKDPLLAEPLAWAFDVLKLWPLPVEEVALRGSLLEGKVLLGLVGGVPEALKRPAKALVQEGFAGVVWAEPSPKGRFRGRVTPLAGERTLLEAFGPLKATVSVESFSQVNPLAAGALLEEARTLVFGGRRALELYAGSGLFSSFSPPATRRWWRWRSARRRCAGGRWTGSASGQKTSASSAWTPARPRPWVPLTSWWWTRPGRAFPRGAGLPP